jgi:hypothetical protein
MTFNEDSKALLGDYQNFLSRNIDLNNVDRNQDISKIIYYNDLNAVKQRISNWVSGRLLARHVYVPDWTDLIRVYDYVIIDAHVTGIINGVKQKIKSKEFAIKNAKGDIDEDLTKLLKTRWFSRYQDYFIESLFFPYSLVELGDYKNSRFNDIKQIKREYVVPQWKSVKLYLGGSGVPRYNVQMGQMGTIMGEPKQEEGSYTLEWFESPERIDDYIFMQNPIHDLGLLDMAAPHALGKMGSFTYFLDYLQKFVIPFRVGKTNINDPKRRTNMDTMLANIGGNGYAALDLDDELEFMAQSGSTTAPFTDLFKYSNNEISKAFVSAVGIFDEKNFVGSAEAGERMMDYIVQAYCTEMEYNINDELIPRLSQRDKRYVGKEFDYVSKEVIPYMERVDAVVKLSQEFNLNPEEVSELVNMEIIPDPSISGEEGMDGIDKIKQEAQSRLKGTVGGVQGILGVQKQVAEGITPYSAGIAILLEIYGFSEKIAREILGDPKDIKGTQLGVEEVTELEKGTKEKQEEVKKEVKKDIKEVEPVALYPDKMIENAKRALKYLEISKKSNVYDTSANFILSNTIPDMNTLLKMSNIKESNDAYTKSIESVEFDLNGGKEGKEWAIKQLNKE